MAARNVGGTYKQRRANARASRVKMSKRKSFPRRLANGAVARGRSARLEGLAELVLERRRRVGRDLLRQSAQFLGLCGHRFILLADMLALQGDGFADAAHPGKSFHIIHRSS